MSIYMLLITIINITWKEGEILFDYNIIFLIWKMFLCINCFGHLLKIFRDISKMKIKTCRQEGEGEFHTTI